MRLLRYWKARYHAKRYCYKNPCNTCKYYNPVSGDHPCRMMDEFPHIMSDIAQHEIAIENFKLEMLNKRDKAKSNTKDTLAICDHEFEMIRQIDNSRIILRCKKCEHYGIAKLI